MSIPNNTTGYNTPVKQRNCTSTRNQETTPSTKLQYAKACQNRTTNKNRTSEPTTELLKAQTTKKKKKKEKKTRQHEAVEGQKLEIPHFHPKQHTCYQQHQQRTLI
jgi:hypothetical protein